MITKITHKRAIISTSSYGKDEKGKVIAKDMRIMIGIQMIFQRMSVKVGLLL
jgi:hypothetical protein